VIQSVLEPNLRTMLASYPTSIVHRQAIQALPGRHCVSFRLHHPVDNTRELLVRLSHQPSVAFCIDLVFEQFVEQAPSAQFTVVCVEQMHTTGFAVIAPRGSVSGHFIPSCESVRLFSWLYGCLQHPQPARVHHSPHTPVGPRCAQLSRATGQRRRAFGIFSPATAAAPSISVSSMTLPFGLSISRFELPNNHHRNARNPDNEKENFHWAGSSGTSSARSMSPFTSWQCFTPAIDSSAISTRLANLSSRSRPPHTGQTGSITTRRPHPWHVSDITITLPFVRAFGPFPASAFRLPFAAAWMDHWSSFSPHRRARTRPRSCGTATVSGRRRTRDRCDRLRTWSSQDTSGFLT